MITKRTLGIWGVVVCGVILNVFYLNASRLNAFQKLTQNKLPAGVPAASKNSSQCFLTDEVKNFESWVESKENSIAFELCGYKPFIKPISVVTANQYYTKGSGGSTFDCLRYRKNYAHTGLAESAVRQIANYADTMMNSSRVADRERGAKCLSRVYLEWAYKDGFGRLAESGDPQPDFIQMWLGGALASTYARYRSQIEAFSKKYTTHGGEKYSVLINAWFERTGIRILDQISKEELKSSKNKDAPGNRSNMGYWRAYALLATAVNTQNISHIRKSKEIFDQALKDVTNGSSLAADEKGFLPHELKRMSRALSYHQFALQPLAGMVNLSSALSCDFLRTDQQLWSFALLLRKTTEGKYNPDVFAEASFCQVNEDCERPLVAPRSAFVQSASGNGEPFFPLVTNLEHKRVIGSRVASYLRSKNIEFKDLTGRSIHQRLLGGDLRFAPKRGSLRSNRSNLCQQIYQGL